MKKLTLLLLISFNLILAACGDAPEEVPRKEVSSQSLATHLIKAEYRYSLETDKLVHWDIRNGFSPATQCDEDLFLDMNLILHSAKAEFGPIGLDLAITANNPLQTLTLFYLDGSQRTYKLHKASTFENEDTLSNAQEAIDFFESIFSGIDCQSRYP